MSVRKITIIRHQLDGRRVPANTPGAVKVTTRSAKWYGDVPGRKSPVPLSTNKAIAVQMLGKLLGQAERERAGVAVPGERYADVPLRRMVADFRAHLAGRKGRGGRPPGEAELEALTRTLTRVLDGCGWAFPRDLSAESLTAFLEQLRRGEPIAVPPKEEFTTREACRLLGIAPANLGNRVRVNGLATTGKSRATRYPRETVLKLCEEAGRGRSERTIGTHLRIVKRFSRWLASTGRHSHDPFADLDAATPRRDHRHGRRALKAEEVSRFLAATLASDRVTFGLSGEDRHAIYLTILATGFRRGEVAELTPERFLLDHTPPVVILAEDESKNRKGAVQPIPAQAVPVLRDYLHGRDPSAPVWPGRWSDDAADMLRYDLRDAGIPYRIDGPDGPLYADFHALRHTFIASLKRANVTLSQAMRLMRHSDPRLTVAVYGREDISELAGAVNLVAGLVAEPASIRVEKKRKGSNGIEPAGKGKKPKKPRGKRG